ncbi:MAG: hypothetical protein QOD42_3814 [Sphingomonadales bacterium]|nr:hypothetical protein [Sphingomonadales bacterium]
MRRIALFCLAGLAAAAFMTPGRAIGQGMACDVLRDQAMRAPPARRAAALREYHARCPAAAAAAAAAQRRREADAQRLREIQRRRDAQLQLDAQRRRDAQLREAQRQEAQRQEAQRQRAARERQQQQQRQQQAAAAQVRGVEVWNNCSYPLQIRLAYYTVRGFEYPGTNPDYWSVAAGGRDILGISGVSIQVVRNEFYYHVTGPNGAFIASQPHNVNYGGTTLPMALSSFTIAASGNYVLEISNC